MVVFALMTLSACTEGTRQSGSGGLSVNPPALPPLEEPPPPPPPGPTPDPVIDPTPIPEPVAVLPPLAPVIVDLNDNHQVGVRHWPIGDTAAGAHGEPVGALECFPTMPDTYHVHTHLSIFLDGVALAIPRNIGLIDDDLPTFCAYPIHTHDYSGKIHVEAAAPGIFTLGQFFTIWGQPLGPDNVAGLTGKPIVVYVTDQNGVVTVASGNWSDIELLTHREVTIQVGTPVAEIPNYTWRAH
jgi:hypothetical protein